MNARLHEAVGSRLAFRYEYDFCEDHARAHIAEAHEGDEAVFLPVVNSPRVGVCGYTGPRDARYEVRPR